MCILQHESNVSIILTNKVLKAFARESCKILVFGKLQFILCQHYVRRSCISIANICSITIKTLFLPLYCPAVSKTVFFYHQKNCIIIWLTPSSRRQIMPKKVGQKKRHLVKQIQSFRPKVWKLREKMSWLPFEIRNVEN